MLMFSASGKAFHSVLNIFCKLRAKECAKFPFQRIVKRNTYYSVWWD